jgi:hypothetical protein
MATAFVSKTYSSALDYITHFINSLHLPNFSDVVEFFTPKFNFWSMITSVLPSPSKLPNIAHKVLPAITPKWHLMTFIIHLLAYPYAMFATMRALGARDTTAIQHWLKFWVILSFFFVFETISDWTLGWVLPYYYPLKLGFVIALQIPALKLVELMHNTVIRPIFFLLTHNFVAYTIVAVYDVFLRPVVRALDASLEKFLSWLNYRPERIGRAMPLRKPETATTNVANPTITINEPVGTQSSHYNLRSKPEFQTSNKGAFENFNKAEDFNRAESLRRREPIQVQPISRVEQNVD